MSNQIIELVIELVKAAAIIVPAVLVFIKTK